MAWLWAASFLWAFSFGLIKGQLTGFDPVVVAAARLGLAAVAFAPLLVGGSGRPDRATALRAALLGV
ncbi:EamA family transporter, partial [bacterium]|nr:EamA family transporter [bacterium]